MKLFTNEIVFRGHPDKVCDQISAALLDAYLDGDRETRAGIETVGGKGKIFITGEVTSAAKVDVTAVVRRVLGDCGYDVGKYEIINNLGLQSRDIALGVDVGGAGDNGMMFGYACADTAECLPDAMVILQKFARYYDKLRLDDARFLSDGKAQITGEYDKDFKLKRIITFTICYQNLECDRSTTDLMLMQAANEIAGGYGLVVDKFLINPTGRFEIGGFDGDAGLTGRKIVVDSYQSFANVGGGCMNGKDPSKVDLSGTHKARALAKEILKEHKLRWCEVQLSYAIGRARPLAIYIDSNHGNIEATEQMYRDCEPENIIKDLNLRNICYEELAKFGHFNN